MAPQAGAGGSWTADGLTLVFLFAALASLIHLLVRNRSDVSNYLTSREADVVHLYMNATMALMYSNFYDDRSRRLVIAVYAVAAVVLGFGLISAIRRPSPTARSQAAGGAYHLLGTLAMLYATWLNPMTSAPAMHMGLHATAGPRLPAILLSGLFGLDGILTGATPVFFPLTWARMLAKTVEADTNVADAVALRPRRDSRALLLVIAPHVLMDFGMAAMLIGWPPM